MAVVVVVLGAYTRLVHAGLGCPDWPTCYGHLWVPNSADEIHAANQSFIETPVETDKTWPEQIHRIFASHLGLVILIIFALSFAKAKKNLTAINLAASDWWSMVVILLMLIAGTVARVIVGDRLDLYLLGLVTLYFINLLRLVRKAKMQPISSNSPPLKLIAFMAGFVVLQGLFGMWTVTLKLWPQVVTSHLLGGFATLAVIWLLIQRIGNHQWLVPQAAASAIKKLNLLAVVALVMVLVQIALGGWTTSNYAALACADFPLCHNSLWPAADFAQGFNFLQHVGPNYLGGLLDNHARTAIHLGHRIGALLTTLVVLYLSWRLWQINIRQTRVLAVISVLILAVQLSLGISNIEFGLPLAVAVAHNGVGALLLLTIITVNHRIRTAKPNDI